MNQKVSLWLVLVGCMFASWLTSHIYREFMVTAVSHSGATLHSDVVWLLQLLLNLLGYCTVILPVFILYKYLHRINYFDKIQRSSLLSRVLAGCLGPAPERLVVPGGGGGGGGGGTAVDEGRQTAELALCLSGLLGAYLVWGLLQEKIMTQSYTMPDGSFVKFHDSQFLVFTNRFSACLVAIAHLITSGTPIAPVPLYKYSYCSLTNIVSAWCQYEALKYVSFPTQVLSKSCKVVPVLAMSRLVSGVVHASHEYATGALLSLGMLLFLTGSAQQPDVSNVVTASGALLLILYMLCDSFTSSWQNQLFRQYHVTPIQMMFGVNLCSCILTGAALAQGSGTADAAQALVLLKHPVFACDVALLAASSALGQLLIYRTIAKFGAVVFTIIMTLRQAISILLSCLVFGHAISWYGGAGIAIVFISVLLRVYCRQRITKIRARV